MYIRYATCVSRSKIHLNTTTLSKLYWQAGLSLAKIGSRLNCSWSTVANRLREANIPLKKKTEMRVKYRKKPFQGSLEEKAYILGFRLGDLNVYKPYKNSKILVIRCHTTIRSQAYLIRSLFYEYGGVKISKSPHNGFTINCFVDNSFAFLLPKILPKWVFQSAKTALPFIAGYIDAEGTFGLNQGKGRLKVDAYDFLVLRNICKFLRMKRMVVKFRHIAAKNSPHYGGGQWNGNLWRLSINSAQSLEIFTKMIYRHLRHAQRRKDAAIVLRNIHSRRSNGTIM